HNTVIVEGQDQMQRAGRFLWLDWAQAQVLPAVLPDAVAAQHNGYARLGVHHRRTLQRLDPDRWVVLDELLPAAFSPASRRAAVNWLLPDCPWEMDGATLVFHLNDARLELTITPQPRAATGSARPVDVSLVRAGQVLYGNEADPRTLGWVSPLYTQRLPALNFRVTFEGTPPFTLQTQLYFRHYFTP
ncbi:MAG: hypothetical protein GYA17_13765, partial [Chloroflexi bacterium]|nr:hypothetical protein [Chloroflexota bacterium]